MSTEVQFKSSQYPFSTIQQNVQQENGNYHEVVKEAPIKDAQRVAEYVQQTLSPNFAEVTNSSSSLQVNYPIDSSNNKSVMNFFSLSQEKNVATTEGLEISPPPPLPPRDEPAIQNLESSPISTPVLRNWKAKPKVQTINGHTSQITTLIELKNGTLVSGAYDAIKLWNQDGDCLATLSGHTNQITTLIELKNGTFASRGDRTIKLWNQDGDCLATLSGHTSQITTLIELKNGTLVSGAYDGTIKLWKQNGFCLATLSGHSPVSTLIELKNGTFASAGDTIIKLWKQDDSSPLATLSGHTRSIYTLIELKDGTLVSGAYDGTIKLWRQDGQCLSTLKGSFTNLIELKDGILAIASGKAIYLLVHITSGFCLDILSRDSISVSTLIELKDGILASCSANHITELWKRDGTFLATLSGNTLIELKDGTLVSGAYDGTIKLWTFPVMSSQTTKEKVLPPFWMKNDFKSPFQILPQH